MSLCLDKPQRQNRQKTTRLAKVTYPIDPVKNLVEAVPPSRFTLGLDSARYREKVSSQLSYVWSFREQFSVS